LFAHLPDANAQGTPAEPLLPDGGLRNAILLRCAPFLLLAGLFIAYYQLGIFVRGDSFQSYATFNYAYWNLLTAGEFPQWFPYAAYGSPSEGYMMTFFGSFQLLAVLCGAALHAQNVWLLFCVSIFAESIVYVCGAYLLGLYLYKSEFVACAVACWIAASLYWNVQVFWSHRALLYIPFMVLFTLRFHKGGDLRDLLRLGLALGVSVMGNNIYTGPVYALFACVFFLALRVFDRKGGVARLARPGLSALAELGLLALLGGLFLFLFLKALDGAAFTAPGRDPVTGASNITTFLNYGGSALGKLPELVLGRSSMHPQFLFYLGLGATGLVLYALRRVRGGVFLALACSTLLLLLLSLGPTGLVAYGAYWFPGMNRFRHLSYLLPMVRLLLFFLAGYGLDHALEKPRQRRAEVFLWLMLGALGILVVKDVWLVWSGIAPELGFGLLVVVCLASGLLERRWPRGLGVGLGLGLALLGILELGFAHDRLLHSTKSLFPWEQRHAVGGTLNATLPQPQPFLAGRPSDLAAHPQSQALTEFCARQAVNNFTVLHFTGGDFCAPAVRIDYAMPAVLELLERAAPGALARINEERDLNKALGLVYWLPALDQPWFREALGGDGNRLVLETPQGERRDASSGVRRFSANHLVVDVDAGPKGGALYYADAYHPGWRALVDGQSAPVERSHGAFKAVALQPGPHRVELSFYRPAREWARRALGVTAALALGLLVLTAWRGRPRTSC